MVLAWQLTKQLGVGRISKTENRLLSDPNEETFSYSEPSLESQILSGFFCLILLSDMVWSPWLLMNLNNSIPTKLKGTLENVRKKFCVLEKSSRYLYADLDDSCTVMLRLPLAKVPFLFCPSHFWFLSMNLQFRKTFAWFSRDIFKNKKRQHCLLKIHRAISSERRVIISIRIPT